MSGNYGEMLDNYGELCRVGGTLQPSEEPYLMTLTVSETPTRDPYEQRRLKVAAPDGSMATWTVTLGVPHWYYGPRLMGALHAVNEYLAENPR